MSTATAPVKLDAPTWSGSRLATLWRADRPLHLDARLPSAAADRPAQAYLYRMGPAGEQQWHPCTRRWQAPAADDALGQAVPPLEQPPTGAARRWSFDPATARDADGAPMFATDGQTKHFAKLRVASGGALAQAVLSPPSTLIDLARVSALALPAPTLTWPGGGAAAPIERPVDIAVPPVTLPDGQAAQGDAVLRFGLLLQRDGGLWWHEKAQAWRASAADAAEFLAADPPFEPLVLQHQPGKLPRWTGQWVAAGVKDGAGAPRFVPQDAGGPSYTARLIALVQRDGVAWLGLGPSSAPLQFISTRGRQRFTTAFDTAGPDDCTEAELLLRDAAGRFSGWLRLASSPRATELAQFDAAGSPLARITLNAAGEIELQPAAGRRVRVLGDIETERIRYQPAGGGGKRDL